MFCFSYAPIKNVCDNGSRALCEILNYPFLEKSETLDHLNLSFSVKLAYQDATVFDRYRQFFSIKEVLLRYCSGSMHET